MVKVFRSEKGRRLIHDSYDALLSRWGIGFDEQDINTRYGTAHIVTAGDRERPVLMLFHGVGDDSALMWIFNVSEWAKCFYIIAVDILGGPGKSVPNDNYGMGFDMRFWIDDIVSALKIDRLFMAGTSYGAAIVQGYAAHRPEAVEKIVCLAGGLLGGSKSSAMIKMIKIFLPEALFPNKKNIRKLIGKLCGKNIIIIEKDALLMDHWFYLLKYFNNMAISCHRLEALTDDQISAMHDKALYLIGEEDKLSYSPDSIKLLESYGLKYETYKDVGHAINHEIADVVNNEVIRFLK